MGKASNMTCPTLCYIAIEQFVGLSLNYGMNLLKTVTEPSRSNQTTPRPFLGGLSQMQRWIPASIYESLRYLNKSGFSWVKSHLLVVFFRSVWSRNDWVSYLISQNTRKTCLVTKPKYLFSNSRKPTSTKRMELDMKTMSVAEEGCAKVIVKTTEKLYKFSFPWVWFCDF